MAKVNREQQRKINIGKGINKAIIETGRRINQEKVREMRGTDPKPAPKKKYA